MRTRAHVEPSAVPFPGKVDIQGHAATSLVRLIPYNAPRGCMSGCMVIDQAGLNNA